MVDEERLQDYSNMEYVGRKKKNRRKPKPNLILETNPEDSDSRDPESEESNVDARPVINEGECSTKEGIVLDGMAIQRIEGSRWIRTAEGPVLAPIDKEAEQEPKIEIQEPVEPLEPFNEKALSRFAATYELEKYEKHALIIFNQEDIDDKWRYGTRADVDALTNTFEKFGFEVKENVHHDLTKEEIFQKLEEFMKRDYTDYGCVGVAVLTHGSSNGRLRAKDKQYSEIEIINHLRVHNKPTLVTKPRLLILQACRGTRIKPPVPVLHAGRIQTDTDPDLEPEPYHLPEEADMLILHSSYVGSPALRHEVNGSWFIQTLCQKIDQLAATHDLESIVTEVKRGVAIDRYHLDREYMPVQIGQMPVLTSTLIRKLYLKKLGDPPPLDTGLVLQTSELQMPVSTRKDSRALDPSTPLLPHFGPCHCFLEHFNYIRDCLRYYVDDNPDDVTGRLHLDLADEFDDRIEHNTQKQKMLRIIHDHLKKNAKEFAYYKYLYLHDK